MPSTPSVAVVIPCYNQARFLADAVESVLWQSLAAREIIVVDDGSTDDTRTVAARYKVKYVHQANQGLARARNRGITETSGEYLVFLDADDRLLTDALAAGVNAFSAHRQCGFVYRRISSHP